MSHQTISGALPASINKQIIGTVFNSVFAPSTSVSSQNVPAVIRDFLLSRFESSTHAADYHFSSFTASRNAPCAHHRINCLFFVLHLVSCILLPCHEFSCPNIASLKIQSNRSVHTRIEIFQIIQFSLGFGVCMPNTRLLMAILSVLFTLMLLCESFLLILDMNGISVSKTLWERTILAGLKWLPLSLSSWVYSWGMASSIYNMYSQIPKGILGKLMACKHSALVYNALVSGFLASVIICQYPSCNEATSVSFAGYGLLACLDSFHRISAHFERMAASYDPAAFSITKDLLPELPGLLEMNQSFLMIASLPSQVEAGMVLGVHLPKNPSHLYFLLGIANQMDVLFTLQISLPLYYIYFRLIRNVKKYHNSMKLGATRFKSAKPLEGPVEAVEDGCEVRIPIPKSPSRASFRKLMCSDDTQLILAAALSLGHSLVEVTVMIRFVYLLRTSGTLSAQAALLTNTALITNFISAFTGLASSWIFFSRSRGNHYKALWYRNPRSIALDKSVVSSDLFDTWTLTSSMIGDIHPLPEPKQQEGYFVPVRPPLKHFPDIAQVKQLC
ncbi:hypothetical protein VP01_262g2 [Puccinia sorghi]|uniref:Uncharacterized protein n=1 Tax=Puccinia sorghi TaxID=27349 RepID=A0A0L6V667_9BASI|nr:hypothetical protein VP01_262g2 [Puccinia sorghi]